MKFCPGCGTRVSIKKAKKHSGHHYRHCRAMGGKLSNRFQRLRRIAKK